MTEIKSNDISVVLQGPIDAVNTKLCVKSIKKYLPDAEIIISTWEGENVYELQYDFLVINKDPGYAFDDRDNKRAFNINRWIVSSANGVAKATKKYVLKCRTDVEVINTGFLKYWDKYEKRDKMFSVLEHKIIIPSPYTLKYLGDKKHSKILTPLHVSDWYCFGLKNDVQMFVNCPLITDLNKFARYYEKRNYEIPYDTYWWMENWYRKMAPEQYIGLCLVQKKFKDIDIIDAFHFKNLNENVAERILIDNFIVLDPNQYGIVLNKYRYFSKHIYILNDYFWKGMYRNKVYERVYYKRNNVLRGISVDSQNLLHIIYPFKKQIIEKEKIFIHSLLAKAHRIVDKIPPIHIISFSILHVGRGKRVYNAIKKQYRYCEQICILPYRGTGDAYIVGNYYKNVIQNNENRVFVVQRNVCKKILNLFGIKNVVVLSGKRNQYLQEFQKIMHCEDVRLMHYAAPYNLSSCGYNMAGFKKLNFADFYDYIVFGETTPILYEKMEYKSKKIDYEKYGYTKGKTVLLAPYSDSIESLEKKDWIYIAQNLKEKGYVVVTNCANSEEKPIKGTDAIFIPFEELAEFIEWCGFFISVRSGLCDIISTCDCRKIIFYPHYIRYKYGRYIDFFTLNIKERNISAEEYEYKKGNNNKVVKEMLNTFETINEEKGNGAVI